MDAHLRAGVAIYNEGRYHAAHDAWEDYWLDLDGGADERLLHGLIQFTAVVHHVHGGNWSGAQGLADSAGEYLADLPADYRGLNLAVVRPYLDSVATDPEHAERVAVPELTVDGTAVGYDDLDFESSAVAAAVLAEEDDYDEATIERALAFARADLDAGEGDSEFVGLVFAFVRERERRPVVFQRLSDHVSRREQRESDVEGLFE